MSRANLNAEDANVDDRGRKATGPWQFTLRSAVLLVTVGCIVLAYFAFFRRHTANVRVRFATLTTAQHKQLINNVEARSTDATNYQWVRLDKNQAAAMPKLSLLGEHTQRISIWPRTATSYHYGNPVKLALGENGNHSHTTWTSGTLNGFLGSRRAGPQLQFRVECDVRYERPDPATIQAFKYGHEKCDGKLEYEGPAPDGALVFFTPLGSDSLHVVVFDYR